MSVVCCTSSVQSKSATMPGMKFDQLKYRRVRAKKSRYVISVTTR